jgi:hypothetical protein
MDMIAATKIMIPTRRTKNFATVLSLYFLGSAAAETVWKRKPTAQ